MNKKPIIVSLAAIGIIAVSITIFLSWLSLGGCPPSYWIEVDVITETSSPTTNITLNDLPSNSVLKQILVEFVENASLTFSNNEVPFSDWNITKLMLESSSIISTENNANMWSGYVYFENILLQIQLWIIVC